MDPIVLAEKIFRIIRTRQTQLTEIIINNQVKIGMIIKII
jgi:hypothetical protein